jgi:hypothetical protein
MESCGRLQDVVQGAVDQCGMQHFDVKSEFIQVSCLVAPVISGSQARWQIASRSIAVAAVRAAKQAVQPPAAAAAQAEHASASR